MQAIITKFLPATNFKPSRIKATCERGSITISADSVLTGEALHIAAVNALPTLLAALAVAEAAREFHIGTHVPDWPCAICAALAALDQGGTANG